MEQMTFIEKAITTLVLIMAGIGILGVPMLLNRTKNLSDLATVMITRFDQVSGSLVDHDTRIEELQGKVASMENTLSELSGSILFLQERRKDMLTDIARNKTDIRAVLRNKYACSGDLYYVNSRDNINETDVTSLIYGDIDDLYISDRQYDREILCLDKLQFSKHFIKY